MGCYSSEFMVEYHAFIKSLLKDIPLFNTCQQSFTFCINLPHWLAQYAEFSEEIKEYLDDSGLDDVINIEGLVSKVVNILGKSSKF